MILRWILCGLASWLVVAVVVLALFVLVTHT